MSQSEQPPRAEQAPEPEQTPEAGAGPLTVDVLIGQLVSGLAAEEAAQALAQLVNRGTARLHALARGEATARRGAADWPVWAQLQNASRGLVLQASTCRDLANRLSHHDPGELKNA